MEVLPRVLRARNMLRIRKIRKTFFKWNIVILSSFFVITILYVITNKHGGFLQTSNGYRSKPSVTALVTEISRTKVKYSFLDNTAHIVHASNKTFLKTDRRSKDVNNGSSLVRIRFTSRERRSKTKYNHWIDLMTWPPYHFDPNYRNPCWKENNTLRCLPYFLIAGVKKCGTTEIWSHLLRHPGVVAPGFKEAQWFARRRFVKGRGSFDTYINLFGRAARKIEKMRSNERSAVHRLITGEASPSNLHLNSHWRYLPGNEDLDEPKYVILDYIYHFLPKAKLILIFRDPVERLYSEYYHEFGKLRHKLKGNPQHFHELVAMGLRLFRQCLESRTLRSCVYDERIYKKTYINIQLGIYHVYWRELTRLFPRDQILVLQNRDLQSITDTMGRVFEFLGLRAVFFNMPQKTRHNKRRPIDASKGDMLKETRHLLEEFYKPHNEEMFRITGDEQFLYVPQIK